MAAPKPEPAPVGAAEASTPATLKAHHAIAKRQTPPWWAARLPGMREWAAVGFFLLAAEILRMIHDNPKLLDSAPFMQFAGGLMAGGVLLVGNFLFGGNKNGSDTNAQMVDALKQSNPPQP